MFSYFAAYDADEHASISSKLHCSFVRYGAAISTVYTTEFEMIDCCLCILLFQINWLIKTCVCLISTCVSSLSTMLNTSFGGSDVDDDNGDSYKTSGCGESSNCGESVDCGESCNC